MGLPLDDTFSLVRGGPAYSLQSRLGLLSPDGLPGIRCAAAAAALAWLPLAILALFDSRTWSGEFGVSFVSDFSSHARFLFGTFALVLADRIADKRVSRLLDGFSDSGIVAAEQRDSFVQTLVRADKRTSSRIAEGLMLAISFAFAFISTRHVEILGGSYWITTEAGGLSLAGQWTLLVSSPIYFFLILRWLWRFGVWAVLLRSISKLDLRLVPTHPDRCGGLAFLTLFPVVFTPLALILSVVIAASCLREVTFGTMTFEGLRAVWIVWTVLIVFLFVGPLSLFTRRLFEMRETEIIRFSGLISNIKRRLEQEMMARVEQGGQVSTDTISASSDIDPAMANVLGIKVVPVEIWAITPLVLSTLLPFLAVAATLVPLGDLFRKLAALIM